MEMRDRSRKFAKKFIETYENEGIRDEDLLKGWAWNRWSQMSRVPLTLEGFEDSFNTKHPWFSHGDFSAFDEWYEEWKVWNEPRNAPHTPTRGGTEGKIARKLAEQQYIDQLIEGGYGE